MNPSIIVIIQRAGYFLSHVLSAQGHLRESPCSRCCSEQTAAGQHAVAEHSTAVNVAQINTVITLVNISSTFLQLIPMQEPSRRQEKLKQDFVVAGSSYLPWHCSLPFTFSSQKRLKTNQPYQTETKTIHKQPKTDQRSHQAINTWLQITFYFQPTGEGRTLPSPGQEPTSQFKDTTTPLTGTLWCTRQEWGVELFDTVRDLKPFSFSCFSSSFRTAGTWDFLKNTNN